MILIKFLLLTYNDLNFAVSTYFLICISLIRIWRMETLQGHYQVADTHFIHNV